MTRFGSWLVHGFIASLIVSHSAFGAISDADKALLGVTSLLSNGGAESGVVGWSGSTGTVVSSTTRSEGTRAIQWNVSATGTLSHCVTPAQSLSGVALEYSAKVQVPSGAGGTYEFCSTQNGTEMQCVPLPASGVFQQVSLNLPGASTSVANCIRVKRTGGSGTDSVRVDEGYLGKARNIGSVAQPVFVGSAYFPTTGGCGWSRTNTALGAFNTAASCPGPTIDLNPGPGVISTTDTDLPQITVSNLPGGYCSVTSMGQFVNGSANSWISIGLSDGTTSRGIVSQLSTSAGVPHVPFTVKGVWATNPGDTKTFSLVASSSTGFVSINNDTTSNRVTFTVECVPSQAQSVVLSQSDNWMVDANLSGGNYDLGSGAVSAYQEMANASITLTNNAVTYGVGIPATIACNGTNSSTGSTCAVGNESNGIVFNVPKATKAEACVSFTHFGAFNPGSSVGSLNSTFQIVQTNNSSQTVIQEGKSKINSGAVLKQDTGSQVQFYHPDQVCGTFDFTPGVTTLRVMYEQETPTALAASWVLADGSGSAGQRDVHWTVRPLSQTQPQALIPGSYYAPQPATTTNVHLWALVTSVCSSNPCTVADSSGGISQVARLGSGNYEIQVPSGTCSGILACTWSPINSSTDRAVQVASNSTPTSTAYGAIFQTRTFGALDAAFNVSCDCRR